MDIFYIVSYEVRETGNLDKISDTGTFLYTVKGRPESLTEAEEIRNGIERELRFKYRNSLTPVILSISKL